ncbi:uncharacterized protein A4U43_C01F26700 [Asparagus officinalis]|uniref:Uncharacterized protein n=1 Tax=Asparagus officinalis TaxID=4686 RepID=A0A5P1FT84_ASPOF|nr:uncharacterized protein A4U43_C01F26700 [Asparagus officinalis]
MTLTTAGEQMPCRLTKFEENFKFKEYKSPKFGEGLGAFVKDLKESYPSIEHVYVWHALCGYWGGLRPKTVGLPEARLIRPRLSPGLEKTMQDLAVDKIVSNGVGLVEPTKAHELYEGLHSHLEKAGIDGVKVDVIQILEMVSEEYGGRVELAKAYYKGLTESVRKHFKGNGVIASMEHCNDFMFLGTEAISLGRVGDDFWCTDPAGDRNGTFWLQGMPHHGALPPTHSLCDVQASPLPDCGHVPSPPHPCAHFHAASRAYLGGPVYGFSDSSAITTSSC